MKEIIYIQAGEFSNYTGTHFWNTQEAYFTYEDYEEPLTSYDISFREGISLARQPTLYPRLLIFDQKSNFGTLARSNALVGDDEEHLSEGDAANLWHGDVIEYRQDLIHKSSYQHNVEEVSDDLDPVGVLEEKPTLPAQDIGEIRYWSDYNRVYYTPRTIQKLPDPAEWELGNYDWLQGQESFTKYDEESDVMEGSLRLFFEECDLLQGIQVINDSCSFGGFMSAFLTALRDDFRKLPTLVFPLLSDTVPRHIHIDDSKDTRNAVNDALFLRSLNEISSMTIPIEAPSRWSSTTWPLNYNPESRYHQSAVLSTHIENATLPLRLKATQETLESVSAHLNWRGITPFGSLSGLLPVSQSPNFSKSMAYFSPQYSLNNLRQYSRRDVTRGFFSSQTAAYDNWCATSSSLEDVLFSRVHAPAYPLPTSFPSLFRSPDDSASGSYNWPASNGNATVEVFSSVSVTSGMAQLFRDQARLIQRCIQRRTSAVTHIGLDIDELKELGNDLWGIHDNFSGDTDGSRSGGEGDHELDNDDDQ